MDEPRWPHLAYRILEPSQILKLVVSHEDDWPATRSTPLAAAMLSGTAGMGELPFSGLSRLLLDIHTMGGSERTLDLLASWVELNPEQAAWISGVYGTPVERYAAKTVEDLDYQARQA